ncbi:MAG: T9SS type A sorting domain-containing protein [Bacteroidota bacterium]
MRLCLAVFILLVLQSCMLQAQNYSIVKKGTASYFFSGDEVRAVKWDSIEVNGTDSIFYSFNNVADTTLLMYNGVCVDTAAGSVSGKTVVKRAGSLFEITNCFNDTIVFRPQTNIGGAWELFRYPNNHYYEIHTDSAGIHPFLGISDSVRYYSVQAKDELGNNINSDYNGKTLIVSEDYGPLVWLNFYLFPFCDTSSYHLIGHSDSLIGFQNPSFHDIYRYDINDEFHFLEEETNWEINWTDTTWYVDNGYRKDIIRFVIDAFLYSDSVLYSYHDCIREINFTAGIPDTIYYEDTLTEKIDFTSLDVWQFDHEPLEYIADTSHDSFYFYHIKTSNYGGRKLKYVIHNELMNIDSCWKYTLVDPGPTPYEFVEECGGPYHYFADWMGYVKQNKLVYYNKGGEIWGNPVAAGCEDLLSGVNTMEVPQLICSIYPNPSSDFFKIFIQPWTNNLYFRIFNSLGQPVKSIYLKDNYQTLSVSLLPAGVYYYNVTADEGTLKSGIIVISR